MILTLYKLRMHELISGMLTSKKRRSTSADSKAPMAALYIFLALIFVGMAALLCVSLCIAFSDTEYAWLYFAFTAALAFSLCFIGSVFAAMNYLYSAKDNELLLSMPIKPGDILLSRMLMLLTENYLFAFIVLIPAGIVWCIFKSVTLAGVICYILCTLFLPLLSLTLSCFFGWIIKLITTKMRSKKAITLVIYICFFAAYMWFCSSWTDFLEKLIANGNAVAAVFSKYLFPFYHFGKASLNGNFLSLICFLLCTLVPFAAAYLIIKSNYLKIMTANSGEKKKKYHAKEMHICSVKAALVKKEVSHYLSSPLYMLNASTGAIMAIIMSVALLINSSDLINAFTVLEMDGNTLPAAVSFALCVCLSMIAVSAPSISVEGKSLWLLKSLPVKAFDTLDAKALCHIVVTLPFVLISSVLCTVGLHAGLLQFVQLFTFPMAVVIFCGYFGVAVNLKLPKFDWISEIHCVKQSASVAICMFGMMAFLILLAILYLLLLSALIPADICVLLYTVIFLLMSMLLRKWLQRSGSIIFSKLQG